MSFKLKDFPVLVLIALVLIGGLTRVSVASDVVSIYERQDKAKGMYQGYDFPPPSELLDEHALKRYHEKMLANQCNGALMELQVAFKDKHPEARHPMFPKEGGLLAWMYIIEPKYYPEALFCSTMKKLKQERESIRADGLVAPRFAQKIASDKDFADLPFHVRIRDVEVGTLILLALNNYAPAQLELAKLSDEGTVLKLTPAYNFYILARALRGGLSDLSLFSLLKQAREGLGDAERKMLKTHIDEGIWPRSDPIVVD